MQSCDARSPVDGGGAERPRPQAPYYALSGKRAGSSLGAILLGSVLLAALLPFTAHAAEAAEAPPPPPLAAPARPPATPSEPETGLEPEITITTRDNVTYEEYRLHGKLYMVKVTPKRGKPYYLIDDEGSGQFRRSDIETRISVPNWVIKSW